MSSSSKVIASLIAGLAAGTALGILVAPAEGRQSRQSLCNTIRELRYSFPANANTELYRFSNWRRRLFALVKAQLVGPEPDMPDDLEHG
jgi:gas vesicle protein